MSLKLYVPPLALCAVGLTIHQSRFTEIGRAYHDRQSQNQEIANVIHSTVKTSQQKLVNSGRALQRFKAGCIAVVDEKSQQLVQMMESQPVLVAKGIPTPLDEGEVVCNELGDTAVVKGGKPADIARIAPEHEAEFLPFKNRMASERIKNQTGK